MIAETVVAEEMLRFAGVTVADLEASGGHSLLGNVVVDLDLPVTMVPAVAEHCLDFEISLQQQVLVLPEPTW